MPLTAPKIFFSVSTIANTVDAMREIVWWTADEHPTISDGGAWTVIDCYDGTTRTQPAGGTFGELPGGHLWKTDASTTLPSGSWCVMRSKPGKAAAQFEVYYRVDSFTKFHAALISQDDFTPGAGPDATPTLPATILGDPIGTVNTTIFNHANFLWYATMDEAMLFLTSWNGTSQSGMEGFYVGETNFIQKESRDLRPFLIAKDDSFSFQNATQFARIATDGSTVLSSGFELPRSGTQLWGGFLTDDLGTAYLHNVYINFGDAAERLSMGHLRNIGCCEQLLSKNDTTMGETASDHDFIVFSNIITRASLVARWTGGARTNHIVVDPESVPVELQDPGGGVVPDTTAPIVTFVNPPPNSTITPTTAITITVTDETGLFASVQLRAQFPGRPTETIYSGDRLATFEPFYTDSAFSTITDGFQFILRRDEGWPSTPTFVASPVDAGGNPSNP